MKAQKRIYQTQDVLMSSKSLAMKLLREYIFIFVLPVKLCIMCSTKVKVKLSHLP